MTDADYTDDRVLLLNTHAQTEPVMHSLEQAARGIGLYMNTNKTEFMYSKQEGAISPLSGKPLKLVDKITYLSSNILLKVISTYT